MIVGFSTVGIATCAEAPPSPADLIRSAYKHAEARGAGWYQLAQIVIFELRTLRGEDIPAVELLRAAGVVH